MSRKCCNHATGLSINCISPSGFNWKLTLLAQRLPALSIQVRPFVARAITQRWRHAAFLLSLLCPRLHFAKVALLLWTLGNRKGFEAVTSTNSGAVSCWDLAKHSFSKCEWSLSYGCQVCVWGGSAYVHVVCVLCSLVVYKPGEHIQHTYILKMIWSWTWIQSANGH